MTDTAPIVRLLKSTPRVEVTDKAYNAMLARILCGLGIGRADSARDRIVRDVDDILWQLDYDLQYEDELPSDITQAEYDTWYEYSVIVDGVRMGPKFKRDNNADASVSVNQGAQDKVDHSVPSVGGTSNGDTMANDDTFYFESASYCGKTGDNGTGVTDNTLYHYRHPTVTSVPLSPSIVACRRVAAAQDAALKRAMPCYEAEKCDGKKCEAECES